MASEQDRQQGGGATGIVLRTPRGLWLRLSNWGFTAGVREVTLEDATLFAGPDDPSLSRAEGMWHGPTVRVRAARGPHITRELGDL